MIHQKRKPAPLRTGNGLCNSAGTAPEHYSPAQRLLQRLEGVKETGPDTWIALCPAHDDRNPSLSIKQISDRLLVRCMAHCETGDVLAAVGLKMTDLFDRSLRHNGKPLTHRQLRRLGQAQDGLRALDFEALVVQMAAEDLAAGFALDPNYRKRLQTAVDRIKTIRRISA